MDFVGIKMGDANATCTECLIAPANPSTPEQEIFIRSQPVVISCSQNVGGQYEFTFSEPMPDVRVFFFAITCDNEPKQILSPLFSEGSFITRYDQGTLYVSFLSFEPKGRSFDKSIPFMVLSGNPGNISTTGKSEQNEIVSDAVYAKLEVEKTKGPAFLIAPNPASDFIFMQTDFNSDNPGTITLTSTSGTTAFNQTVAESITELNIGHLPSGLFFYTIKSRNDLITGKIIVE